MTSYVSYGLESFQGQGRRLTVVARFDLGRSRRQRRGMRAIQFFEPLIDFRPPRRLAGDLRPIAS